jgi:acyl-CoA thioester hydrolase
LSPISLQLPLTFETSFRVRYAETDAQGVVHHSNYLVWFEAGRCEMVRVRSGRSYRDLEDLGYLMVVVDLQAHYLMPARFDDLVHLRISLVEWRSRQLAFEYALSLPNGPLLVTGRTSHVVLERATRRLVRIPEALRLLIWPG